MQVCAVLVASVLMLGWCCVVAASPDAPRAGWGGRQQTVRWVSQPLAAVQVALAVRKVMAAAAPALQVPHSFDLYTTRAGRI